MWLSTDPMADKYPSLSPYNYCANNPIKLIDPNGKEMDWYQDKNGHILWRDDVKDQNTTPGGGTYIGKTGNDILSFYKLNKKGGELSDKFTGIYHDGDSWKSSVFRQSNSFTIEADIGHGESTENNKNGLIFEGITFKAFGSRENTAKMQSYGGADVESGGYFSITYGEREYKASFRQSTEPSITSKGAIPFIAEISIPAKDVSTNNHFSKAEAIGGYSYNNYPLGNIPIHRPFFRAATFHHIWNNK